MFGLVVLFASVFIAHGDLPYNGGDEQPCSGRQGTDIGEPMTSDQFVDEFAKALIGMNYEQMKKNDQVDECSTPSECASIWSRVGAKHLREKFVFYRTKGLYEKSAALVKLFNTLVQHKGRKETRRQQETRSIASLLKKQWEKLPLTITEEFRRSFCAFRMLDENTNRDSYEPDK